MRVSIPGFKTQFVDEPAVAEAPVPKAAPLPSIQAAMAMADARQALQKPLSNPGVDIIAPVRPKMLRETSK